MYKDQMMELIYCVPQDMDNYEKNDLGQVVEVYDRSEMPAWQSIL